MEKIATREGLIQGLREMKVVEAMARDRYREDLKLFTNPRIVATIAAIKKDEDRHIRLLDELIASLV